MSVALRPYQQDLISRVYDAYQSGVRNVLAVLPTGGGKSVIVSQLIADGHAQGVTECVIAHRNELVGQMSIHVARRGIPHRIIASKASVAQITAEHRREFGRSFVNPDARCSVVSVDTLVARADTLQQWASQVGRWTIDEAHHVLRENKWGKAVAMFPNAYGLGVTATPKRADGMGLGKHHDGVFERMIIGPTMRELIDIGALCDYEIAVPESDFAISDDELAPSGDWSTKRMREASKRSHIVGDVVIEYSRRALGKRAICFATDVETAGEMAERFNAAGIAAAAVSAKTPTEVRNEYIGRFRAGRLTVLVNVDLFGEGFDVPAVEVVIMARPTASLAVYLQQFGRALRPLEGKPYGLVIDHVSNWKRHGFPDKPHIWTLDRREKRAKSAPDPDDIPLTACRSCSRPYERALSHCPYCGNAPPVPEGGARSIDQVDGDLMLLDRDTLARMRAAMTLEAPADMGARVSAAAGEIAGKGAANRQVERISSQQRLKAEIEQWAGVRRAKGEDDATIQRRFYLTLGIDVLSAMSGSRAEMDGLADTVRSWYSAPSAVTQKKSDEQLMIEAAIERGDQGFRGGWLSAESVSEVTGVKGSGFGPLMKQMKYNYIGITYRTVDGINRNTTLYHTDPNADPADFWVSNAIKSHRVLQVEAAIKRGDQGFRGGWLSAKHVGDITGAAIKSLVQIMNEMGYVSLGPSSKNVDGVKLTWTLYHTDPNADPADFWVSNGYVVDIKEMIKNAVHREEQGFRGGWVEVRKVTEMTGVHASAVSKTIEAMGYSPLGKIYKSFVGQRTTLAVYHTDPNADPADFWVSNGYV